MLTEIGIKPQNADKITRSLCEILADEFVLYVQTLNAHWNTEGRDFHTKHLFFESQYKQLADIIDAVAERIRSLGHYAPATLSAYKELTHLLERPMPNSDSLTFIEFLTEDHIALITVLREFISEFENSSNDPGTVDFIIGVLETHEKMVWMLKAHLA